eukprot:TRINITY_DN15219_c0_g1_i1.p1 TRINITY_DN15219_c0_g1~~TRINITY_DN15219_c0_g1_i1.p1  ORF type:complete len:146 (+),score=17.57 TRINITY_DN15219_c0_g1_i1:331-768(+)
MARLLFAQAVIALFVPSSRLTTAMENVVSEDPSQPELDHVQRWGELVLAPLDEPRIPDEIKQQLLTHWGSCPDRRELLPYVKLCTSSPFARDSDMHRVQLQVTSEFQHLATSLIKALVSLGATMQFGPAPRSNLEHLTQDALDAV